MCTWDKARVEWQRKNMCFPIKTCTWLANGKINRIELTFYGKKSNQKAFLVYWNPCLNGTELFLAAENVLKHNRAVVIMLCLICVNCSCLWKLLLHTPTFGAKTPIIGYIQIMKKKTKTRCVLIFLHNFSLSFFIYEWINKQKPSGIFSSIIWHCRKAAKQWQECRNRSI